MIGKYVRQLVTPTLGTGNGNGVEAASFELAAGSPVCSRFPFPIRDTMTFGTYLRRSPTFAPASSSSSPTTRTARTRAISSARRSSSRPRWSTSCSSAQGDDLPRAHRRARRAARASAAGRENTDAYPHRVHGEHRRGAALRRDDGHQRRRPRDDDPVAVDPATVPSDLRRPGHVHPLRARDGGVLQRVGHTEAAVDLARLAGLYPAGVICEILNEDGTTMRARRSSSALPQSTGSRSSRSRSSSRTGSSTERLVHRVAEARLPDRGRRRGLADHRLPQRRRHARARRARLRRCRRRRERARAHALEVPDRRRLPLACAATAAGSCTPRWR